MSSILEGPSVDGRSRGVDVGDRKTSFARLVEERFTGWRRSCGGGEPLLVLAFALVVRLLLRLRQWKLPLNFFFLPVL